MAPISHRIVVAGSISDHVVVNSSRVFLFDQEYGLSQEEVIHWCMHVCVQERVGGGGGGGGEGVAGTASYTSMYVSIICVFITVMIMQIMN